MDHGMIGISLGLTPLPQATCINFYNSEFSPENPIISTPLQILLHLCPEYVKSLLFRYIKDGLQNDLENRKL